MGMNWIVEELLKAKMPSSNVKISPRDYEQWAREFIFEGIRDQRYGQSFCNRFGITDNHLYYAGSVAEADRYIQENYVK